MARGGSFIFFITQPAAQCLLLLLLLHAALPAARGPSRALPTCCSSTSARRPPSLVRCLYAARNVRRSHAAAGRQAVQADAAARPGARLAGPGHRAAGRRRRRRQRRQLSRRRPPWPRSPAASQAPPRRATSVGWARPSLPRRPTGAHQGRSRPNRGLTHPRGRVGVGPGSRCEWGLGRPALVSVGSIGWGVGGHGGGPGTSGEAGRSYYCPIGPSLSIRCVDTTSTSMDHTPPSPPQNASYFLCQATHTT